MLLAAGLGTRLRPFTDSFPKALLPIFDIPAAQFPVDLMVQASVGKIVANVHHQSKKTIEGLKALRFEKTKLLVSDESDLLLGTAGGIKKALPLLDAEAFFLLNTDMICEIDLKELAKKHFELKKKFGVKLTLAVYPKGPALGSYTDIVYDTKTELVKGLGKSGAAIGKPFYAGIAVVEPELFEKIPENTPSDFFREILLPCVSSTRVGVYLSSGLSYDIGSPALWHWTHLDMLKKLEEGVLPQNWQHAICALNEKIAPVFWVSKNWVRNKLNWKAPCYISHGGNPSFVPPHDIGPNTVLYGEVLRGATGAGIGFQGNWVGC